MARMAGRTASAALLVTLLLAGCTKERERLPAACLTTPGAIQRALERAPAAVTLADGTRLSTCVSRARADTELQTLGAALIGAADRLAARAATDPAGPMRLGYLRGATRRGVESNRDLAANLLRRIEQTTVLPRGSAAARALLARGVDAGEAGG